MITCNLSKDVECQMFLYRLSLKKLFFYINFYLFYVLISFFQEVADSTNANVLKQNNDSPGKIWLRFQLLIVSVFH